MIVARDIGIICKIEKPLEGYSKSPFSEEIDAANARLIAASPGLLAALKRYVNVPVLPDPGFEHELIAAIDQAQDAIAEAEGGSV